MKIAHGSARDMKSYMIDCMDNGYLLSYYENGEDGMMEVKREVYIKSGEMFARIKELISNKDEGNS